MRLSKERRKELKRKYGARLYPPIPGMQRVFHADRDHHDAAVWCECGLHIEYAGCTKTANRAGYTWSAEACLAADGWRRAEQGWLCPRCAKVAGIDG